jgi:hypothetical protein
MHLIGSLIKQKDLVIRPKGLGIAVSSGNADRKVGNRTGALKEMGEKSLVSNRLAAGCSIKSMR